jgi:hypothetical protein
MMTKRIWIGIGLGGAAVGLLCAWGVWTLVQGLNGSAAGGEAAGQRGTPLVIADAKDYAPILRAQEAKLSRCMPMVSDISRQTMTGTNQGTAVWNKEDPDGRLFQSITGFVQANKPGGERGLSILGIGAGPQAQCDGDAVIIQPAAQPCQTIVDGLKQQNAMIQNPKGFSYVPVSATNRLVFLPGAADSCVVVSVRA